MDLIWDFFFDGWALLLTVIALVIAVGWLIWALGYNRE